MRWFILANGEGTRWGNYLGVDKQLITFNNETLLQRMVRILKENGQDDIWIIGKYEVEGAKNYIPNFTSRIPKYEIMKELWEGIDKFVLLYGDCYYTDEIIKDIISNPNEKKWLHWTSQYGNQFTGKPYAEGYAHRVTDVKYWENKCNEFNAKLDSGEIDQNAFLLDWVFCRYLVGLDDIYTHNGELLKPNEVDWCDFTDDFDYPVDYDRFVERTGLK